jgi:hypothetical protein
MNLISTLKAVTESGISSALHHLLFTGLLVVGTEEKEAEEEEEEECNPGCGL